MVPQYFNIGYQPAGLAQQLGKNCCAPRSIVYWAWLEYLDTASWYQDIWTLDTNQQVLLNSLGKICCAPRSIVYWAWLEYLDTASWYQDIWTLDTNQQVLLNSLGKNCCAPRSIVYWAWLEYLDTARWYHNISTSDTNQQVLLNSLGTTPSPGVDENQSRCAFCACAWATSSIMLTNMRAFIHPSPSDITLRRD